MSLVEGRKDLKEILENGSDWEGVYAKLGRREGGREGGGGGGEIEM